jgi:hypothetical protein
MIVLVNKKDLVLLRKLKTILQAVAGVDCPQGTP